jgi:cytochrome c oxidase cbb3-type subunit 3
VMTSRMRAASLLVLVSLALPVAARAADPSQVIQTRCAKCHGKSGRGDGQALKDLGAGVTPVDWADKTAMSKLSDADLVKIIDQGGKALGKSKVMPAYRGKLSPEEITQLVAYIRSLGK